MKLELEHLKKAIGYMEANTNQIQVSVEVRDRKMFIKAFDRQDCEIEITISEDGQMLPKIRKTDILR